MLVPIFQILYYIMLFAMALMSVFIVFHIVFYSYTFVSKILMLAIFVPVVGILLFTNLVLFTSLPLERIFGGLMP